MYDTKVEIELLPHYKEVYQTWISYEITSIKYYHLKNSSFIEIEKSGGEVFSESITVIWAKNDDFLQNEIEYDPDMTVDQAKNILTTITPLGLLIGFPISIFIKEVEFQLYYEQEYELWKAFLIIHGLNPDFVSTDFYCTASLANSNSYGVQFAKKSGWYNFSERNFLWFQEKRDWANFLLDSLPLLNFIGNDEDESILISNLIKTFKSVAAFYFFIKNMREKIESAIALDQYSESLLELINNPFQELLKDSSDLSNIFNLLQNKIVKIEQKESDKEYIIHWIGKASTLLVEQEVDIMQTRTAIHESYTTAQSAFDFETYYFKQIFLLSTVWNDLLDYRIMGEYFYESLMDMDKEESLSFCADWIKRATDTMGITEGNDCGYTNKLIQKHCQEFISTIISRSAANRNNKMNYE
jgi:hypothetical protein